MTVAVSRREALPNMKMRPSADSENPGVSRKCSGRKV